MLRNSFDEIAEEIEKNIHSMHNNKSYSNSVKDLVSKLSKRIDKQLESYDIENINSAEEAIVIISDLIFGVAATVAKKKGKRSTITITAMLEIIATCIYNKYPDLIPDTEPINEV